MTCRGRSGIPNCREPARSQSDHIGRHHDEHDGQSVGRRVGAWTILLTVAIPATGREIGADSSVDTVELSSFEGLSPPDVWAEVDSPPFSAIPPEPPRDYYDPADTTSAVTLRETLHSIIHGHVIYRYTHPSRPGDGNHRIGTWDIIVAADEQARQQGAPEAVVRKTTLENREHGGTLSASPTDARAKPRGGVQRFDS